MQELTSISKFFFERDFDAFSISEKTKDANISL